MMNISGFNGLVITRKAWKKKVTQDQESVGQKPSDA